MSLLRHMMNLSDISHTRLTLTMRSHTNVELDDGHIAHIKLFTKNTPIKITQWNSWCVRSTWMHGEADDIWHKTGDRHDIKHERRLGEGYDHAIVVHVENYVRPQGCIAQIEIDDDTPIATMASSMTKSVSEGSQSVREADIAMCRRIANSAIHTLFRGCRTLALPLFLGAYVFGQAAVGVGFPISTPDRLYNDPNSNILNTKVASLGLAQDDPFCLWISSPAVNPASDVACWAHTVAVDHVSSGRIAVLDCIWQFTFERYNISDGLESIGDPLATEVDELSVAWSHCHGSNSGRILNNLADVHCKTSQTAAFQPQFSKKRKYGRFWILSFRSLICDLAKLLSQQKWKKHA